ncbi:hypothetical protein F-liban_239 [Faustovirus]|nr:hypothetical protein F-liban_239 [Faustovirus]
MQSYTNCGSIKPEHRDAKRKRGNNNNDDDNIDDNKRFKSAIAKPLVIRELFPMGHPG